MVKVTSTLQSRSARKRSKLSRGERLRLFDAATARQRRREEQMKPASTPAAERDWRREDLYTRGKPG